MKPNIRIQKLTSAIEELKQIPGLYEFTQQHCFLAGGAVRDVYRNAEPKDYDMFFKSSEALIAFRSEFAPKFTETVLGNYDFETKTGKKFQFISMYTGSPDQVIAKFDWNVNQQYFDPGNDRIAAWNTSEAKLHINCKALTPLTAMLRLPTLLQKGYTITSQDYMFALSFISHLGLLTNEKKASEGTTALLSSGGGVSGVNVGDIVVRAREYALPQTRLGKALTEDN